MRFLDTKCGNTTSNCFSHRDPSVYYEIQASLAYWLGITVCLLQFLSWASGPAERSFKLQSLWASMGYKAVTRSCPEIAEYAPRPERKGFPSVCSPINGRCVLTRNVRTIVANTPVQSPGYCPAPCPCQQPVCTHTSGLHADHRHDFTHLCKETQNKLLDEPGSFFPICPLGEEIKFSQ